MSGYGKRSRHQSDTRTFLGRFGWQNIGSDYFPFIIRKINGKQQKFVSLRMCDTQLLLKSYMQYLHADIYTCISVKSHRMLDSEAKLLNDINCKHSDQTFGKEPFIAGEDRIVRLEHIIEFYNFVEICFKKLLCNAAPGGKEKCGLIRINLEFVVPYCTKDDQKYVPLFFFDGETEILEHQAIKIEKWDLAYLKFCCKFLGIRNELYTSDSYLVTKLENIKNYFPSGTNFEEYWPAKVDDTQILTNQQTSHGNPSDVWIRVPPTIVGLNNGCTQYITNIPNTLAAPSSVATPPSYNTYLNGLSPNQMPYQSTDGPATKRRRRN